MESTFTRTGPEVEKNGNGAAAPRHLVPLLAAISAAVLVFAVAGTAWQANLKLGGSYRGYRTRSSFSALTRKLKGLAGETEYFAREFVLEGSPEAKLRLAALGRELNDLASDAGNLPVIDETRRMQMIRLSAAIRELADCAAMLGSWNGPGTDLAREAGATYLLVQGYAEQIASITPAI